MPTVNPGRPELDEHLPYYSQYINLVPDGNLVDLLAHQFDATHTLLAALTPQQANFRPKPDDWNIVEVVGHLADTERVFAYRALRIGRNDPTSLPSFDQDLFVANANFASRPLANLLDEFAAVRAATLAFLRTLDGEALVAQRHCFGPCVQRARLGLRHRRPRVASRRRLSAALPNLILVNRNHTRHDPHAFLRRWTRSDGLVGNRVGFQEVTRWLDDNGKLAHGEMTTGSGRIMLATPTPAYESPKHHRAQCAAARAWSAEPWVIDGVLVYVDDVDQHYVRATAAGAAILGRLEDGFPGRRYRVEDVEGHRWMFMQRG